jgi:sialate O-acetylesterase
VVREPAPFRVYQRARNGRADIPCEVEGGEVVSAAIGYSNSPVAIGSPNSQVEGVRFEGGKLRNVPVGGPYTVSVQIAVKYDNRGHSRLVGNVFVGDLWVLAGQSNMQGVGDLVDVTPPDPHVMLLGMDGNWSRAEEPLHWLADSPDPVHSGDPSTRAERSARENRTRTRGAGLGLPFATAMVQATGVPVGLIACAHGGTSMEQWDPEKKGQGGRSLYGSMLRQVNLAGGKVKGVLWYQGEAEANPERSKVYPETFARFIEAVRSDFQQPDLPFYFVQIGRFVHEGDPAPWNAVQDAQRRLAERVPNTAVVSVVDLELDDAIHIGTQGLKRAGRRLSKVALRELFGQAGATTPTFDRVTRGPGNTLVVKFKGVNLVAEPPAAPGRPVVGLRPLRHIAGFSIRKEDGTEVPLIFDAAVGNARDTVVLKLTGKVPEKAALWYGHGYDPDCNLTDGLDMAVPVFGPIPLGDLK